MYFYNICYCYPVSKKSRMWDSVNQLSSQLPNVISLLQGHTSLSKMSWTDINGIVKSVLGEMDDMSHDLGEMKGEFENHALSFIGVTVSLALFTVLALILLCLLALRMRRKTAKSRGNSLPVSSLEGIRRNLQEFHRIRKMSVGERGSNHLNTTSYYNPAFNPHYNQNLSLNSGPPNYIPGPGQALPPSSNGSPSSGSS